MVYAGISNKIMTAATLKNLLLNNVLDLKYTRRTPVKGKPSTRRMLCTKSYELLNSTNGRVVLNYKPPKRQKQFNEGKNNAVVVWDIIMQDYRIVSAESVQIVRQVPANEEFWKYFNEEVYVMTTEQKGRYMNS